VLFINYGFKIVYGTVKRLEGSSHGLSRHFPGRSEERHGKDWYPIFGPGFDTGTFRIRSKNVDHCVDIRLTYQMEVLYIKI
jgi:hypothetical protein